VRPDTASPPPDELDHVVYDELRRIAHHHLRAESPNATLSTTDVLHEAWLKFGQTPNAWGSRAHFFGAASRAMRQVLVDYARHRKADKRGGGVAEVTLTGNDAALAVRLDEFVALDDALDALRAVDDRLCRLVELRFFGGLSEIETATLLGTSERTVRRDWTKARLFLARELGRS
jgi:RNA polymerase sigma factor (TIGR02999 family)